MRRTVLVVALFSSSGCFGSAMGPANTGPGNIGPSDLTARERGVLVFQVGEKPDCKYAKLGIVEATSGSAYEMGTYASSMAKLQRETANLGGNAVIVIDHSKNQMADQATGMAIRCE